MECWYCRKWLNSLCNTIIFFLNVFKAYFSYTLQVLTVSLSLVLKHFVFPLLWPINMSILKCANTCRFLIYDDRFDHLFCQFKYWDYIKIQQNHYTFQMNQLFSMMKWPSIVCFCLKLYVYNINITSVFSKKKFMVYLHFKFLLFLLLINS